MNLKNIQTCFFCNKLTFSNDKLYSREYYQKLQKLIGTIPNTFGGKIGNKIVCDLCKNEIQMITYLEA